MEEIEVLRNYALSIVVKPYNNKRSNTRAFLQQARRALCGRSVTIMTPVSRGGICAGASSSSVPLSACDVTRTPRAPVRPGAVN